MLPPAKPTGRDALSPAKLRELDEISAQAQARIKALQDRYGRPR